MYGLLKHIIFERNPLSWRRNAKRYITKIVFHGVCCFLILIVKSSVSYGSTYLCEPFFNPRYRLDKCNCWIRHFYGVTILEGVNLLFSALGEIFREVIWCTLLVTKVKTDGLRLPFKLTLSHTIVVSKRKIPFITIK